MPCIRDDIQKFGTEFLPRFYYVIFTLSLLGNGLVLFVIIKFENLRVVTNIYLLNLVGSNLIFTFGLPFWAAYHSDYWWFGSAMCKLVGATSDIGMNSSVFFLTLLTFDRYLAVVHATAISQLRKSCSALVASAFVWLICGSVGICPLLEFRVDEKLLCQRGLSRTKNYFYTYLQFVGFFLLPLLVVVYSYVQIIVTVISTQISGKHRTLRIVFFILLLFFTCWTPYNIVQLINLHTLNECNQSTPYALYVTRNIANLYFCINPVFYTFLGRKFQNHTRKLILGCVPCLANYLSEEVPSQSFSPQSRSNRTDESVC